MKRRGYGIGDLVTDVAAEAYAQDGIGSLRNLGGIYAETPTTEEQAAGIQALTEAGGTPTYGMPEYDRLQVAPRDYASLPSMYQIYLGGGFPEGAAGATDVAQDFTGGEMIGGGADPAQIPGAIDTLVGVNTPEQQRLIDEGIGVQLSPGQPISHPAEGMPLSQAELDEFNARPVSTDYVDPYTDLGFEEPRPTYADQYLDPIYETGEHWEDTSGQVGTMTPTDFEAAGMGVDDMYATDYPGEPQTVTGTDQFRPRVSQLGPGDLEVTGEPLTGTDQFSPRVSRLGRGETLDPMDLYSGAADEGYPEAPTFEDEYMGMAPGDVQGYAPQETLNIFQKVGQTIEGAVNDLRTAGHNVVQRGTDFIVDIGGKTIDIGQSVKAGTLSVLGQLVDVPFLGPVSTLVGEGMPEWSEEDIAAQKYAKPTTQFDPSGSLGKDEFGINTRSDFSGRTYEDRVDDRINELEERDATIGNKEGGYHENELNTLKNRQKEIATAPKEPSITTQVAYDDYNYPGIGSPGEMTKEEYDAFDVGTDVVKGPSMMEEFYGTDLTPAQRIARQTGYDPTDIALASYTDEPFKGVTDTGIGTQVATELNKYDPNKTGLDLTQQGDDPNEIKYLKRAIEGMRGKLKQDDELGMMDEKSRKFNEQQLKDNEQRLKDHLKRTGDTAAITPTTMTDIPADYEYTGGRDIDPFDYGVDEETAWSPGVGAEPTP